MTSEGPSATPSFQVNLRFSECQLFNRSGLFWSLGEEKSPDHINANEAGGDKAELVREMFTSMI